VRLSELKRGIPLASKKALTARLRFLEAAQIVSRRDLSSSVLHVEYALTDAVREQILALLECLATWGDATIQAQAGDLNRNLYQSVRKG
jgi:DNA-binding HxlR family transcriptional regulator